MKATCTWGEGPDVMIELDGTTIMLYEDATDLHRATHGFVSQGSLDLTIEEALDFCCSIYAATLAAVELQRSAKSYFEDEEKREKEQHLGIC